MAQLISAWIKQEQLETLLNECKKGNQKGVAITIGINDEAKSYGQNVSAYISQTKEDKDAGKKRQYIFNGKTVWSSKGEFVAPKETKKGSDDLPF